jgi:hypothetical protein
VYEEEQRMMRRRLEEAVAAFREALKERMREQVPLQWATAQNNLEIALKLLGERAAANSASSSAFCSVATRTPLWPTEKQEAVVQTVVT